MKYIFIPTKRLGGAMKEVKKTQGGNKTTFKVYMQNYWQLYLMLVIPVVYMILLRYKPMLGAIIAF